MIFLYGLASIALLFYSYTQVDLALTLSRANIFQTIQKTFQHVGYFDRPLSVGLYLVILTGFFGLYIWVVRKARKKELSRKQFWWITGTVACVLVFAYPAFSYDFFNYMFTAKTVLLYQKNPYTVIPLQFTGVEPWLSFMRWTHLPSAYTPFWIALTLLPYALGFGYFLAILWNIKILVAIFYIATTWYIGKSLTSLGKNAVLGMAIFALNPLVITETLVSGHNDIVMMAILMIAYYLYLRKKFFGAFFALSLSVATKLMTIFIFPVYLLGWPRRFALAAMIIGFVFVGTQRELLPWYVVWLVPMYALIPEEKPLFILGLGVSLGFTLSYVPVLYFGNYDASSQVLKFWLTFVPIFLSFFGIGVTRLRQFALTRRIPV